MTHSECNEGPEPNEGHAPDEGSRLAREWREARDALLELASKLPETRAYRNTDRPGWTLKHELAHLAGIDEELRHLLDSARSGWSAHDAPGLRRRRGQAMHAAQEMRLARLRDHLAAAGEATATAIEDAGEALGASVSIAAGMAQESAQAQAALMAAIVRERLERAKQSVALFQQHLG